jgi:3-hydroxymyristoyl/3-hydroxydecanoyl-(acyl carrier protein) dehydratase
MWYLLLDLEIPKPNDIKARVMVNEDSPWFSGHFPDRPILPGIAQLKMVADVIALARQERLGIKRLHRVKFKRIVKPGERLDIHAAATNAGPLYSFRITHDTEDVCSGTMSLEDQQHAETTHERQP